MIQSFGGAPRVLRFYFGVIVVLYAAMALLRHWHFQTGAFDLGVFDQAIWHYSRLERPASSLTGFPNILGDHFHPALALLAPLYWVLPKVEVLLIAQAVLLMLPVFPIYWFVEKRLGEKPALFFAVSYSLLWGIQLAAQFDFHEISLAVPAVAFAIHFLDEKRWKPFWACLVLLMAVKEDLCLLVIFMGFYLMTQQEYKQGLAVAVAGIGVFILELKVLIPWFAGGVPYKYWSYSQLGDGPGAALWTCLTRPWVALEVLFSNSTKVTTMVCIFAPFLMLAFLSPLFLLAIPLVLERMLSSGSSYWILAYHYTAVVSPVVVFASADGLDRFSKRLRKESFRRRTVLALSGLCLFLNLAVLVKMPLRKLLRPSNYGFNEMERTGRKALALVPSTASVLAQDTIVPHLSHRASIRNIMPETIAAPPTEAYILVCEELPVYYFKGFDEVRDFVEREKKAGYVPVLSENGWTVLKRSDLDPKGRG